MRLHMLACECVDLALLQVVVVATDIPSVSYMPPTTELMLCAYVFQVYIALHSVIVYLLWYVHSRCFRFRQRMSA